MYLQTDYSCFSALDTFIYYLKKCWVRLSNLLASCSIVAFVTSVVCEGHINAALITLAALCNHPVANYMFY